METITQEERRRPLDPGGATSLLTAQKGVLISTEDLAPNRVTVEINNRYAKRTEVAKIFSQKDGMRKPLTVEKRRDGMLMVEVEYRWNNSNSSSLAHESSGNR